MASTGLQPCRTFIGPEKSFPTPLATALDKSIRMRHGHLG
jgi:hypothetical protein